LRVLNLSFNFVAHEESLLGLASFPALEWVDLRGNMFNQDCLHRHFTEKDFPLLFDKLVIDRGLRLVLSEPKPSSFVDSEAHILQAPKGHFRNRALPAKASSLLLPSFAEEPDNTFLTG
jgi:hypothetical protein